PACRNRIAGSCLRRIMGATPRRLSPSSNGNDGASAQWTRRQCMSTHWFGYLGFRNLALTVIAAAALSGGAWRAAAQTAAAEDPWPDLARNVFGDRPLLDGADVLALETPTRAEDAAIVPLTVRMRPDPSRHLAKLTVVIDENPAPVAATFSFGPKAGVTAL